MLKSLVGKINSDTRNIYLLIVSILIVSYDTYWFGTSGIKIFEFLRNVFAISLPLGLYITHPYTKFSTKGSVILFGLVSIIFLSSIFNSNSISAPLLIFSGIFIGFYLVTKYSFYSIAQCFSNIIILISIYSFVIWIGCTTGLITMFQRVNIADNPVFTAFGCVFFSSFGDILLRNSGIFREPGVYMIVINFAVMFELFVIRDRHMWSKVGLLGLTMISLFSTGGFICLAVTLVTYSIRSIKGILTIILLIIPLSLIILPLINEEILDIVFLSKFNEVETGGSGFARMSSFFVPLEIFIEHPILGCGFKQFEIEYVREAFLLYGRHVDPHGMSSNTIMNIFAIWGMFMGIFVIYGFYKFASLVSFRRPFLITMLLMIDMFLMFSNENMPYWPFMYIFLIYGITQSNPKCFHFNKNEAKHSYLVKSVQSW